MGTWQFPDDTTGRCGATDNAALLKQIGTWEFTDSAATLDDLLAVIDQGRASRATAAARPLRGDHPDQPTAALRP
jgi:hypothetical protein